VKRENLHEGRQICSNAELLAGRREGEVHADGCPELKAHGIVAGAVESLYAQSVLEPASPWQNGFVESFHGRFRDECLNREQLWTLTEARVVIEDFRIDYNTRRPHSRLGYRSPVNYAQLTAAPTPVGLRPPSVGTASTTTDRSTHNYIPD